MKITFYIGTSLFFFFLYSCRESTPIVNKKEASLFFHEMKEQIQLSNINGHTLADTAAINRQIEYAHSIRKNKPDSANTLFIDAAWNSLAINYDLGVVNSLFLIGSWYNFKGVPDSALRYYQAALPYARKLPPESCMEENLYTQIGKVYYSLSQPDSALFYVHKGLDKLQQHEIKKYQSVVGYRNAFNAYKTAGGIWMNMNNLEAAMPYLNKSEEMAMLLKDSAIFMEIYNIKATILYKKKLLDSAVLCYERVLNNNSTSLETRIDANYNLGSIYVRKEAKYQPDKAIPYFEEAIHLCRQLYGADSRYEIRYLFGLGTAFLNQGFKGQNKEDYRKAEKIFKRINKSKSKTMLAENLPYFYSNLAIAYGNQNQYEKAYEQSMTALQMRDSLYQKEKLDMMGKLEVQYRVAEKDKQLAQNRLQISEQQSKLKEKNLLIGGTAISAVFLAAFLLSAYRSSKHKRRVHAKELLLLGQQQEIQQLQSMMKGEERERGRLAQELHDGVGGMLAAIKMNISAVETTENPPVTAKGLQQVMALLEDTAGEVRRTAHNLMPDILLKHNLPEALRIYCDSINNGGQLQIDLQFHTSLKELDKAFELSLYRVLQELIQNIVKHAAATHAVIQFRQQETMLHVTVEDNGIGFDASGQQEGLGLNNIRSRIQTLKGMVSIDSAEGRGTTCYMEFNLGAYKNNWIS